MSLLRQVLDAHTSSSADDDEIEEFGVDPRDNATPEQLRQLQEDVNYQIAHDRYEEERTREHDRREFGHLVLTRSEEVAVTGRLTPGGTELDRDGWPVEPPVVTAIPVGMPVITGVFVPETPPRTNVRRPAARRSAVTRNHPAVMQLTAAEERIAQLQDENRRLKRNNRDMRSHRDTYITLCEELSVENDDLIEENKELRKKQKVEVDEFPLTGTEDTDFPITSAEKGEDNVIDLTGDNIESENE
jgi:hypothetical protein